MSVIKLAIVALVLLISWTAPARSQAPEPRYEATMELVGLVEDAVDLVESEGVEAACGSFRTAGSRWLEGDSYVFVVGMDGKALCHPARPTLEGQYLNELKDPKGRPILANMLREVEESDEGWVHYQWPRPGEQIFRWKTTYVRTAVDPAGARVMVSSGRYQMEVEPFFIVEQVEDAVELILSEGEEPAFTAFRDPRSGYLFYTAYVFVLDEDGVLLVNNAFPENEGRDLSGLADIDGRLFVQEMLQVPVHRSAWIHYKWPKPGDERPSAKSSFVRRIDVDGRQLVVGSGVYFDQEPDVRVLGPKPDVD